MLGSSNVRRKRDTRKRERNSNCLLKKPTEIDNGWNEYVIFVTLKLCISSVFFFFALYMRVYFQCNHESNWNVFRKWRKKMYSDIVYIFITSSELIYLKFQYVSVFWISNSIVCYRTFDISVSDTKHLRKKHEDRTCTA